MTRSGRFYRCHTCSEILGSWAAAEDHADAHHGARLDIVDDDPDQPELAPVVEDVPTGDAL